MAETFLSSSAGGNPAITAFMERKKPPPFNQPRKVVKKAEEDTNLVYPKEDLKASILLCAPAAPLLPHQWMRPADALRGVCSSLSLTIALRSHSHVLPQEE